MNKSNRNVLKKRISSFASIVLFMFLLMGFSQKSETGSLSIEFTNLEKADGYVKVNLYDCKKNWLKKGKAWATKRVKVNSDGSARVQFDNLPLGEWAAAGFHDLNGNNKLDKNFIGLPKEPYGFSQKFKKKTRKPHFKEVKFSFNHSKQIIRMDFQRY